ncbi:MAG: ATP-dependent Clp protease proteolytic subunit [Candidatus Omnitrophica bacterium]|nr:ATP-dependent Clp protease proteolytic subunit [Candidatus Omnitrophota bacterium]
MRKRYLILLFIFYLITTCFSQETKPVYILPIKGVIDLGLSGATKRILKEAKENNASAIILEIDTFGGRADAAIEIADALEDVKPTKLIAFVDDQAWSAGALIALACEEIIMSEGSSIGSAEPRGLGFGQKDELTDEKTLSAIRAKFKALAEENNHPLNLALAMVDKETELKLIKLKEENLIVNAQELEELKNKYKEKEIQIIKTINPKGKLLNLTAKEAKELGLAKEVLSSRSKLLKFLGLENNPVIETHLNWSENLVRFLTHPIVSPLLLVLGFLGIFFELQMPGWGISGTFGLICLGLFFWGHYLVGLATMNEILIFVLGILLLLLEIFVIPGFGLAGISGIGCILLGIYLSLIKHPLTSTKAQISSALYTLSFVLLAVLGIILLTWKFLPKTGLWRKIVLSFSESKKEGFKVSTSFEELLGKTGKTLSSLRPSGRAEIEGKTFDVISEGEFIDKGKLIKVIRIEGNKIIVKEG